MRSRLPQVFVSSTFYDLQQVRADLASFIEQQLGYGLLASEHRSFPIDPRADTIENCRRRVEEDADVFVLIIGARHGSVVIGTDRSVTNLEYSTARAKGIPIFVFIHRDVLALLPLAERNPNADFSGVVDSPKLFDFVKQVSATDRVWTFPFELAQDIVGTLRTQLAYEVARGLGYVLRGRNSPSVANTLAGSAFRLAIEQPEGWEAKLFAQVLLDEIGASANERRAHDIGLATGFGEAIGEDSVSGWLVTAMEDAQRMIDSMEQIAKGIISAGFTTENVEAIVHGAREIARVYRHALEWAARLRRAHVPVDWRPVLAEVAKMLDDFLNEAEQFGPRAQREIEQALNSGSPGLLKLRLTFNVNVDQSDLLKAELKRLQVKRQVS
jgi:hypothetical protein